MKKFPDLIERKRKQFLNETNGKIRLVDSVTETKTFLQQSLIEESHRSKILFRCELCGEYVDSFTELSGQQIGFSCGCAEHQVRKILSDEFFAPGSYSQSDLDKAIVLKAHFRKEKWEKFLGTLKGLFSRK